MSKTRETADLPPEDRDAEAPAMEKAEEIQAGTPAGKPDEKPAEDPTIEELAALKKTSAPVFAAVKEAERWAGGKRVSEGDYVKAVERFLKGPAGGIGRKEKEADGAA